MTARILIVAAMIAALAPDARSQVLRELDPVELRYDIHVDGGPEPAGSAEISFRPVDTVRGRRLEIRYRADFTLGAGDTVGYHESATLSCDGTGVEKFETARRFGDIDERYLGLRTATDYAVTATVRGETRQKTETGEVQRSNFGLFCAGFLETPADSGDVIVDYPLLFPTLGRHYPRQKVRVGWVSVATPDGPLDVIHSRLRKLGGKKDQVWHRDDEHQALIRMVETADYGTIVWSLVELNGRDVSAWPDAVAAAFPQ